MCKDDIFLNEMRRMGDPEADDLVARIFKRNDGKVLYSYLALPRGGVIGHKADSEIRDFLLGADPVPTWFDSASVRRGQAFFRKYALDIMSLLGALSLPFCYAATPGNKAIHLTEKMRKAPGKRLLDTAHFIIEVMKEGSFEGDNNGHFEVRKTRLIHALVRHYVTTRGLWDASWGTPVNQEDMAGTNLAFSYIILRGLRQSGFRIAQQDGNDFLHAWRFIGHALRIDDALLPASENDAEHLERTIRKRNFRDSEEGRLLTRELVEHYRQSFPAVAAYFVESQIRYFVGPEVASVLGLREDPMKDRIIRKLNRVREALNRVVVNPYSYPIMMRNHEKLKARYSG
jgi:hypothetical protein